MQLILVCSLQAQTPNEQQSDSYTFIFKGEPIEYALQQLVQGTSMDLIYDPEIIPDHTVYKTAKKQTAENILRLILEDSGLDFFQLSSGTYVLTKTVANRTLRGSISGQVVDKKTGEPLPGANIILVDAHGGTSTSRAGFFNIPRLEMGPHEITITYVGYKPVRDTVWVPQAQAISHEFALESKPVIVEPVVVSGIQKRLPTSGSFSEELKSSELKNNLTFGGTDAIKSLDVVSGLNFSLPLADFNIQGGNSGEHQLRLDGVPIYNPVSMGRLLGAFSPYAVKKINVSKAGFETPLGSQLSGIIDVKQDITDSGKDNFLFQINQLNANARFSNTLDIEGGPKINFMLAARGNLWRWYQQPDLKQTLGNWDRLDPLLTDYLLQSENSETIFQANDHAYNITYYDLHAAVQIEHNEFHKTRISAYHGKNMLETDLFSENVTIPDSQDPNLFYSADHYNWINTMGKVEHQWLINSRFDASLSGYITRHSFDHTYLTTNNPNLFNNASAFLAGDTSGILNEYKRETTDQNAIIESSAQFTLNYSASKNYKFEGGLRGKFLDYRFNLSDLYFNSVQSNEESFLFSGYAQNHFLLSNKTQLSVGSRFTFVPSRDLVFAEPRLSIKHDEPETSIGYLSLKLSGGIYRQFINQFDVSNVGPSSLVPSIRFWAPVDYTTTVPKAYHIAGDILWEPGKNWEVRLESYYKWIPSRLTLDYNNLSQSPAFIQSRPLSDQRQFITKARGFAYGGGVSVKKLFPSFNMALKGGYQLNIAKQRIPFRFNSEYQPLPSNQPHSVNASLNWNIIPRLTFLAEWQGIWGRNWGFRKAYYDYLSIRENRSFGEFSFNDPGSDELPAFSQLNAGISYRQPIQNSEILFRLDVFNLLNHQNVLNWWLSPFRSADGTISYRLKKRTLTGFMPSFSVKFSL